MAATQFRVLVTHNQVHPVVMARMAGIGARVDLMQGPITEEILIQEVQRLPTDALLMRGNPPLTSKVIERHPGLKSSRSKAWVSTHSISPPRLNRAW